MATTLAEAGRGVEALLECEVEFGADGERPELLATRGAVFCGLERYAEAVPFLERALATSPDDMALINLSLAHQQLGRTAEALTTLREAVRFNQDNARATGDLITRLSTDGQSAEALDLSKDYLQRHPGNGWCWRPMPWHCETGARLTRPGHSSIWNGW